MNYFYCGKGELTERCIAFNLQVLKFVRRFLVGGLESQVLKIVFATLSRVTCCEIPSFAELHQLPDLKKRAFEMVCSEFISVAKTESILILDEEIIKAVLRSDS